MKIMTLANFWEYISKKPLIPNTTKVEKTKKTKKIDADKVKDELINKINSVEVDRELELNSEETAEKVEEIKKEFNDRNHHTVSLREVKRELVCEFARQESYMTLVEFDVKDIY